MDISDLEKYGVEPEIIDIWSKAGYNKLLTVQEEAVKHGVLDGESLLIVAPTSSGKTFIGEMAAITQALQGKKTLYLVPFKALAEEKCEDFIDKYGPDSLGFDICISDRDHREDDEKIRIGNYDIAFLTYEKLSALLTTNSGILDCCDCVVVDEVQMLIDPERGGIWNFY